MNNRHRPRRRAGHDRHRGGFTLMEILLSTLLGAVLLAGVWSLYSIFLGLFETGQSRAPSAVPSSPGHPTC